MDWRRKEKKLFGCEEARNIASSEKRKNFRNCGSLNVHEMNDRMYNLDVYKINKSPR